MRAEFDLTRVADLSYTFQPIVDIGSRLPYAYEALLRGARTAIASRRLTACSARPLMPIGWRSPSHYRGAVGRFRRPIPMWVA